MRPIQFTVTERQTDRPTQTKNPELLVIIKKKKNF